MKDWKFYFTATLAMAITLIGLYFITVNSIFSDKVLINVKVQGEIYSLLPEAKAKELIANEAARSLPAFLNVKVADTEFSVATNELNPRIDISQITGFGKGNDLGKVLGDSIAIFSGKVIDDTNIEYTVDPSALIAKLPYQKNDKPIAYKEGSYVRNCQNESYNISYQFDKITATINEAIKNKQELSIDLADYVENPADLELIAHCETYNKETGILSNLIGEDFAWQDYLDYDINGFSKSKLSFKNDAGNSFSNEMQKLASKLHLDANPGGYTIKGKDLYLYQMYKTGRDLDIDRSIANINGWFNDPIDSVSLLSFNDTNPDYLSQGYNIINVTTVLGEGKSRLDIIRGGAYNYRVTYAQRALDAIDLFVLAPGQEFSFYNDTGIRSNRIHVGMGVCNASTTLFRLALMAGFPVTDRSPHTSYIWSYEYPFYPINNVEATYFGSPVIDLKFVNDLNYPVILKTTIDRSPNDGFQYHTVTAYTSPDAPKRTVELTDFKKWNIRGEHRFSSSFTRKVWSENKTVIRQDTYSANYY